ncbi:MAG: hypothetical protein Q7J30_01895 [Candidatus Azambacteria bacterium]|nr:hypothetical protein [Candidatus Azambacteria bacterium]
MPKTTAPRAPALLGLVKKTVLKKEAQVRIFAKIKAIRRPFSLPSNI